MLARMTAIHPRVIAALRDSGGLNAGMPFEMASVPVSATQPEEKARSTRNQVRAVVAGGAPVLSGWRPPQSSRTRPPATSTVNVTMKR
ncbi:MAG: hypothetical protein A3I03_05740 [Candidatus Rokubacteria bacterium RIFCSPLOWO2_02_FULL_68_19]|nr:MAG: hypothetical protein A3I03_05740 [Candidatus Rokubacteria bacterium RIFCSPLOWO2_02_FULL_68_19]